jgi:hypothetical protein
MRRSFFVAFVLMIGCDGSSKETGGLGECAAFTPCGGSLVGTWRVTGICSDITPSSSSTCIPDVLVGYNVTGIILPKGAMNFTDSGGYSYHWVTNGTMKITFLRRCFTDVNMICAEFDNQVGAPNFSTSCSPDTAGDCECTETFTDYTDDGEGAYSTTGNSLTTSVTSGGHLPALEDYCVQGNTLKIRQTIPTYDGAIIKTYISE